MALVRRTIIPQALASAGSSSGTERVPATSKEELSQLEDWEQTKVQLIMGWTAEEIQHMERKDTGAPHPCGLISSWSHGYRKQLLPVWYPLKASISP